MTQSAGPACCAATRGPQTKTISQPAAIAQGVADTSAMVLVPAGEFLMGTDDPVGFPQDGEGPVRRVRLNAFRVDRCAVSNADFMRFVADTGYTTEAERFGWSFVFAGFLSSRARSGARGAAQGAPWWLGIDDAFWSQPEGPGSSVDARLDHPVVHVSHNDALAYCRWAGTRLPTEAEWECMARGGLSQKRYAWGDELMPDGQHRCNIWQGEFPTRNTAEDGYTSTCPVDAFEPNGYGIHNVAGNTWEWCADWFGRDHDRGCQDNPGGPPRGQARVMRGGSYLCHRSYCNRYRVAARTANTPDSSTGNIGFRCVVSEPDATDREVV